MIQADEVKIYERLNWLLSEAEKQRKEIEKLEGQLIIAEGEYQLIITEGKLVILEILKILKSLKSCR